MLAIVVLSAVLAQEPPAPSPPPEARAHVFVRTVGDGPGLDNDGDGQVTREEFAAPLNDAFAGLDKDGDGRLSPDELAARDGDGRDGLVVFIGGGPEGAAGARRFEFHSREGGRADREDREVIILGDRHAEGPDRPGPGRLEIRRMGGEDATPRELDQDGDGKVSEAEFTAPLRDAFARMDADRSGFLEEGERADDNVRVFTHRIERRE